MDRVTAVGRAEDQTARKRLVVRIVLNDLSNWNAGEDLIQGEIVRMGFLICVIRDPDAVLTDAPNKILDFQTRPRCVHTAREISAMALSASFSSLNPAVRTTRT